MIKRISILIYLMAMLCSASDMPNMIYIQPIYQVKSDADYKNRTVTEIVNRVAVVYQHDLDCELTNRTITLVGKGMSFWKLVGEIALKAQMGIHLSGNAVTLLSDEEIVSCYDVAGPYLITLSRQAVDGRIRIHFIYMQDDVQAHTVKADNIVLCTKDSSQKVEGKLTRDAYGDLEWLSEKPVDLLPGMIVKGSVEGHTLQDRFIIQGLQKNTVLKKSGLVIQVEKYDPNTPLFHIAGKASLTDPNIVNDKWIRIHVESEDLTKEENDCLQQIFKRYITNPQSLYEGALDKYSAIQNKTPWIEVLNIWPYQSGGEILSELSKKPILSHAQRDYIVGHGIRRECYICDIYTEVLLNSTQDGKDVFPLSIELLRYKPVKHEFTISYQKE